MDEVEDPIRAQAHHWRTLRDEGLSPEGQREFEAWRNADPRHAAAYAEARVFWEAVGLPGYGDKLTNTIARQDAEEALQAALSPTVFKPSLLPRLIVASMVAAAALMAFVYIGPNLPFFVEPAPLVERFTTELGSTKVLTLSDRTRVTLGPDSVVEISLREDKRIASLAKGNAFFDVASNARRPFIVETDVVEITVTGTHFDVQLRENTANVAVGEGSVALRLSDGKGPGDSPAAGMDLQAGQGISASLSRGFGEIEEVYPAELAAWRTGRLVFSNSTLSEVASELNRYVAKPILVDPPVSDLKISGTFNSAQADEILDFIENSYPVRVLEEDTARRIVSR